MAGSTGETAAIARTTSFGGWPNVPFPANRSIWEPAADRGWMTGKLEVIGSSTGLVPTNALVGSDERHFQRLNGLGFHQPSQVTFATSSVCDRVAFAR